MKRIYVAGASAEIDIVRGYMAQLTANGWQITYDWTQAVSKFGSAGEALTDEAKRELALKDLGGVYAAHVFWMLVPQNLSVGAWIELGAAITHRDDPDRHDYPYKDCTPRIVVSGTTDSIFALLADKRFATHDEALEWLIGGMS